MHAKRVRPAPLVGFAIYKYSLYLYANAIAMPVLRLKFLLHLRYPEKADQDSLQI